MSDLNDLDYDDLLLLRDGIGILQPDSDEASDRQAKLADKVAQLIMDRQVHTSDGALVTIVIDEPIELEETVGYDDDGRVQWAICRPGGGDVIAELDSSIDPDEQERIVKAIAAAFPVRDEEQS